MNNTDSKSNQAPPPWGGAGGRPIGIASDHAGYALKQFVKKYLEEKGYEYKDYGTYTEDSCDYSDFGHALARGIEQGEVFPGIAICGSGEGINMTLNKHQSIRAGLCWIPEIAHLIRQHNNANVLVMPGRFIDEDMARSLKADAIRNVSTRFPCSSLHFIVHSLRLTLKKQPVYGL